MSSITGSLDYFESSTSLNTTDAIRAANWDGSIPVVVTLAPSSLSSPTLPPAVHALLSRHTYLHVGLKSVVERLYQFAPSTLSFAPGMVRSEPEAGHDEEAESAQRRRSSSVAESANPTDRSASESSFVYPVCWFEDEETRMALRWHLFVGVLFDLRNTRAVPAPSHQQSSSSTSLPWKLRLHFTSYPTSQILPLELTSSSNSSVPRPPDVVFAFYRNSLKQALCLKCGHNKVALNVSRESHGRLWEALCNTNYQLWRQVQSDLEVPTASTSTSIGSPVTATNKRDPLSNSRISAAIHLLPVRLLVNARPPLQKRCPALRLAAGQVDATPATLGQILFEWVPEYFEYCGSISDTNDIELSESSSIRPKSSSLVRWTIAGLSGVPLEFPLQRLWLDLCHPDLFLYVVVSGT